MCKQVELCYQFELGLSDTFIQCGYWDSLHKGLLAGETLNHDLRRMQSSYFEQNARRFELSRYISLALLNPTALQNLRVNGVCDFDIPESLFDNDLEPDLEGHHDGPKAATTWNAVIHPTLRTNSNRRDQQNERKRPGN